MSYLGRRGFLTLAGAASGASLLSSSAWAKPHASNDFSFVFLTDTHLQPELRGVDGCRQAFRKVRSLNPSFIIQGGDHVYDTMSVSKERAHQLYDLYGATEQELGQRLYHVIGNHDCFAIMAKTGFDLRDPEYGKRMWEDRFGKTFYSFDRYGVHFIVLDTIGLTSDRQYEGRIDPDQIEWLKNDLAATGPVRPIIVAAHIPLVTALASYQPPPQHKQGTVNSAEIIALLEGHNILAVLQGHTHINERIEWKGIPFITSGAVSGNWWKGPHLGIPGGFTVVNVRGGKLTTHYETYGFDGVEAKQS
jgi:3',5'-cyclic-AMP phosphodiesterase